MFVGRTPMCIDSVQDPLSRSSARVFFIICEPSTPRFLLVIGKTCRKKPAVSCSFSTRTVGPSSMQVWFWVLYQASCFGALADMQLMGKSWERLWVKQICFFQIQSVVNQSKLISWKMLEDLYNHAGVDPKLALGIFWFRILEAQPVSLTEIITQIVIEIACSEQSRTHEVVNGCLPQWNLFYAFRILENSVNPFITHLFQQGPLGLGGALLFLTSSLAVGYSTLPPYWIYWYLLIISLYNPLYIDVWNLTFYGMYSISGSSWGGFLQRNHRPLAQF